MNEFAATGEAKSSPYQSLEEDIRQNVYRSLGTCIGAVFQRHKAKIAQAKAQDQKRCEEAVVKVVELEKHNTILRKENKQLRAQFVELLQSHNSQSSSDDTSAESRPSHVPYAMYQSLTEKINVLNAELERSNHDRILEAEARHMLIAKLKHVKDSAAKWVEFADKQKTRLATTLSFSTMDQMQPPPPAPLSPIPPLLRESMLREHSVLGLKVTSRSNHAKGQCQLSPASSSSRAGVATDNLDTADVEVPPPAKKRRFTSLPPAPDQAVEKPKPPSIPFGETLDLDDVGASVRLQLLPSRSPELPVLSPQGSPRPGRLRKERSQSEPTETRSPPNVPLDEDGIPSSPPSDHITSSFDNRQPLAPISANRLNIVSPILHKKPDPTSIRKRDLQQAFPASTNKFRPKKLALEETKRTPSSTSISTPKRGINHLTSLLETPSTAPLPRITRSTAKKQPYTTAVPSNLRNTPMKYLTLADFKLNPRFNQGLDYAFSDALYGKDRECLPGCIDPRCCGEAMRQLALTLKPKLPPSLHLGKDDDDGADEEGLDDDGRMVKWFQTQYGPKNPGQQQGSSTNSSSWCRGTYERLAPHERSDLILRAQTKYVAEMYGKHRTTSERRRTPPGFWDASLPSEQEQARQVEEAERLEKQLVADRYTEAVGKGKWLFRDEMP